MIKNVNVKSGGFNHIPGVIATSDLVELVQITLCDYYRSQTWSLGCNEGKNQLIQDSASYVWPLTHLHGDFDNIMKLISNSQAISLVLESFQSVIIPALANSDALSTAKTIETVLSALQQRQGSHRDLLRAHISQGEALERELRRAAGLCGAPERNGPVQGADTLLCFESLSAVHKDLTHRLTVLCDSLAKMPDAGASHFLLLRQAAEWESSFYRDLQQSTSMTIEDDVGGRAPPMSRTYLEEFLRSRRGEVRVDSYEQLSGGNAKQTFAVTVGRSNGQTEELIVRKTDAVPFLLLERHLIESEYEMLKSLSKQDFPCPKPFELERKSENIDGSFYIMNKIPGQAVSHFLSHGKQTYSEKTLLQCAEVLAKMHSIPIEAYCDYFQVVEGAVPQNETNEQRYRKHLQEWRQYPIDHEHADSPYLLWLLNWLDRNIPSDTRSPVLTHGDFNVHNILFDDDKLTGVIDWESYHFGAPEIDLEYFKPTVIGSMPWDRFIEHYYAHGGPRVNDEGLAFYRAYSALPAMFSFNKASLNIQENRTRALRFVLLELSYQAIFMQMGLDFVNEKDDAVTDGTATQVHEDKQPRITRENENGDRELTLPDGATYTVHGEWSHYRQPPGPQPNWQESVVISWFDEKNSVGGFHRLGHEPNAGIVALWTNFTTPDGMWKKVRDMPLRSSDALSGGGFGSGDNTCEVIYKDGEHVWTIRDKGVSAVLRHKDHSPNYDEFPKHSALAKEFSAFHFDVAGSISGWLDINGKHYDINGLSVRDHGWGPRDWNNSILSHRWVVGTCGPEFSFYAVAYHVASSDQIARFGWVTRDGVVTRAKSVDFLALMEADGCSNRGGKLSYTLTTGETLDVLVAGYSQHKAFVCHYRGISCVDRPCSFTCNEWRGFCTFETSTNIHQGTRKPGTLVGGVIADGWTPYDNEINLEKI